ncbi:fatty acid desaturase-domain-containing protein [Phakopsora pachyrhizi]|uniref:sphingolipid 4-desaturase n=1 Tax=Phakopsora pachyrhizi TaxID=170000 RepID=A0AAV0BKE0_PHAPC|nr:fatty acid desaturase-domain-containing protein [Phakopsora pachyrhizi]CAH7687508.1 fatty acid desaturase-domain-containing protein [Phakopsora pachyrhizi]
MEQHFQHLTNPKQPGSSSIDWSLFAGAESTQPTRESTDNSDSSEEEEDDDRTQTDGPIDGPQKVSRPGDRWAPRTIGVPKDPNDWLWLMTEEPHRSRRRAILADHPEITKLMGHTPTTKWLTLAVVSLQIGLAYYFGKLSESGQMSAWSWRFFLTAYLIGGTANQNLFLAIHEITHNLAFRKILPNKLLAIFANLPIGVPYSMLFKSYHIEHHRYLGEDGIDTDLPTKLELICLQNVFGKAFFATFQIFFYALRPGLVKSPKITRWVILNFAVQIIFDLFIYKAVGISGLMYLLLSSFFAGSLHPCAAHFIAEHYIWEFGGEQETFSYYGPLNILTYNVGYHNEHHDFPSIPWTRLPELRQIAKEYYDVIPCHASWPMVIYRFIFQSQIGLFSRVKRHPKKL